MSIFPTTYEDIEDAIEVYFKSKTESNDEINGVGIPMEKVSCVDKNKWLEKSCKQ